MIMQPCSCYFLTTLLTTLILGVASTTAASSMACTTLNETDVPFCSMLVGRQVDTFFTASSSAWQSKSYPAFVDGLAKSAYDSLTRALELAAHTEGFGVCEDCATQFKWLLCEGAFPECGFYGCLNNVVYSSIAATCPNLCMCENCSPFVSLDCTKDGGVPNPNYNISSPCDFNALSDTISKSYRNCSSYLLGTSQCETFVKVCSCGRANGKKLCTALYDSDGFTVTGWPTGSCSSNNGWCSLTRELELQARDSASFCPNQGFCLSIPAPLAAQAVDVSAGGISANQPATASYVQFATKSSSDSSRLLVATTPVVVVVAIFLGVLFG